MDKWDSAVSLNAQSFCVKGKHTVPWLKFNLNNALATAEIWNLKGHTLNVNKSAEPGNYSDVMLCPYAHFG
jgi:hypothetical protein